MKIRKNYTIIDWLQSIFLAIIIAAVIALAVLNIRADRDAAEEAWRNSVPMANQCITWNGAGYQGGTGR